MRISVFGLGYVGCVSAACFSSSGNTVVGTDVNAEKVGLVNSGRSPIVERGLGDLIAEMVACGRLTATSDSRSAVLNTDLTLISVGTPSLPNGSLDMTHVRAVCEDIGFGLAEKAATHTVVVRSTMLPGSVKSVVIPVLEAASGKKAGNDFHVCLNPEFLREGSAIEDFYNPPFTLIGADNELAGKAVADLYASTSAPLRVCDLKTAEMVKYACNSFHALKVAFANEIGCFCKESGIDSHVVMDIFCQDQKLNLSSYYLRPGFAFGGSCLPKDLRALVHRARELDLDLPVLSSILVSNRRQIDRTVELVLSTGCRKVGVLGFSFKAGTDDLRESPVVNLIEILLGKGIQLALYDHDVSMARLVGANKKYIESEIPHIAFLMRDSAKRVVEESDVVVIGNGTKEFRSLGKLIDPGKIVIDLVRAIEGETSGGSYHGISW